MKIYFDSGQEYLKLTCSLIPKEGWVVGKKRARRTTGVSTILILGISHSIPENHTNIETYYETVDIWGFKCIKALDHKMKHLDLGINHI